MFTGLELHLFRPRTECDGAAVQRWGGELGRSPHGAGTSRQAAMQPESNLQEGVWMKNGNGRLTVGLFDAPVGGVLPNGDTLLLELLLLLGISMYFGVWTLFRPWGGLFDNRSSSSSSSRR